MNLDDAQKAEVRQWIDQGLKLSEIQSRLETQFGLKLTYMEARFLLDDLKVAPKDQDPPKVDLPKDQGTLGAPAAKEAQADPLEPEGPEEPAMPGGGNVSVSVDQLARPGAMISGKVTFSDGKSAEWYLDQMGRLGVSPQEQGYKPSESDLMSFQSELQKQLARMGYA